MGTNKEELPMNRRPFMQELTEYKDLLCKYCVLAVKCTLTEAEADSMDLILLQAETDPFLSFLLDEVDHLLAHELGLIDKTFIQQQQQKFSAELAANQDAIASTKKQDLQPSPCSNFFHSGTAKEADDRSQDTIKWVDLREVTDCSEQNIRSALKTDYLTSQSIAKQFGSY
jgi:hypothetical protein